MVGRNHVLSHAHVVARLTFSYIKKKRTERSREIHRKTQKKKEKRRKRRERDIRHKEPTFQKAVLSKLKNENQVKHLC